MRKSETTWYPLGENGEDGAKLIVVRDGKLIGLVLNTKFGLLACVEDEHDGYYVTEVRAKRWVEEALDLERESF